MSTNLTELNGLYPMRVVTRLTGLSADTIRVWERRYQAVTPDRTDGNKRRYSGEEVRRLSLLRKATELGHTISEVAGLDVERLQEIISSTDAPRPSVASGYESIIDDYLQNVFRFDVQRAEEILTKTAAVLPPITFSLQFVVPLMHRVGDMWCGGEFAIAHEHIVSGQMRSLLGTMIRHVIPPKGAPRIIVAAPEHHLHEFGALIGAFIAATRGLEPIYLGSHMPLGEMELAAERSGARLILISVVRDCEPEEELSFSQGLVHLAKNYEVWLGVPEEHGLAARKLPVRYFHRYEDLDAELIHQTS